MKTITTLPETVNYHFISSCNMSCRFCFAGFKECRKSTLEQHKAIIRAITEAPLPSANSSARRLNFVGGEPTVYPYLEELILYAQACGLRTSVVTNGFNLVKEGLTPAFRSLELLGLSIDSLFNSSNLKIGRSVKGTTISAYDWMKLFDQAAQMGLPIKINTTVTKYNVDEDLSQFILEANPKRWKVFQGMVVIGQNELNSHQWAVDQYAFKRFVDRHRNAGVIPVVESESVMRGSYAMISPDGRFFDSTCGKHTYSPPILKVGVEQAWNQVCFNEGLFNERTASYQGEVVAHV